MRTPAAWLRSVKRREPGIYAYRTRRHLNPNRSEWGYVGKSRNLDMRDRCHAGLCGRHATCIEKDWWDLKRYRVTLRLPWWLGWDWLTLSLETMAIWLLKPRYNIAKNPWPHVDRAGQKAQRYARDHATPGYAAMVALAPWLTGVRWVGIITLLVGIGGVLWTNR